MPEKTTGGAGSHRCRTQNAPPFQGGGRGVRRTGGRPPPQSHNRMFQLAEGPRRRVFGSLVTADEPCDAV